MYSIPRFNNQKFNCSGEDPALSVWGPMYMYNLWPSKYKHECHYPFMFSDETLQCENYTNTNCGTRYSPTWECKYTMFLNSYKYFIACDYSML